VGVDGWLRAEREKREREQERERARERREELSLSRERARERTSLVREDEAPQLDRIYNPNNPNNPNNLITLTTLITVFGAAGPRATLFRTPTSSVWDRGAERERRGVEVG
jgi:hypothetical protein